ncbi:hypothetical protein PENSTE_c005G09076 [Penicillium steckii]|uniref:Uncharacterized protein n=1 Tax=Penicillium steckii TaxID=303698 RepID=A0A1V6TJF9_9EURO|nr:hypothetical protein PENSTE_c005G09076 [Penicillium steckii]
MTNDKWLKDVTPDTSELMNGKPEFRRVQDLGLQQVMDSMALSVSNFARDISQASITGSSGTPESCVIVKWPWITLPAVLIVLGGILLVATVLSSIRRKASLWKSSILVPWS